MSKKIVKMFRFVDGHDVVSEVLNGQLKSPFDLLFTPQGSAMIPYMAMSKGHQLPYPKEEHIIFECEPADNLLEEYINATKPKGAIETPQRPGLLVPG